MVGSRKDFEYTSDAAETFAVSMDESNGEAVGNADFTPTSTAVYYLPRNITPRFARYRSADGNTSRKIILTEPDATVVTLPDTLAFSNGQGATTDCFLVQLTGETTRPLPRPEDTGLNDGDLT